MITPAERMTHSYCALHHDLIAHHYSNDLDMRRVMSAPGDLHLGQKTPKWNVVVKQRQHLLATSLVAVVFFGCAAVAPTELAVHRDPNAMHLITLVNYVLVTVESWLDKGSRLIYERKIPMGNHILTLIFGLVYNTAQNGALQIGMPMSNVLILKNSQLLFQMAANAACLGERYTARHKLAALVLVAGILIVVAATTTPGSVADLLQKPTDHVMLTGLVLMLVANISRALSSVVTQRAFAKCGNHYVEKLFYEHALGLPFLVAAEPFKLAAQAYDWSQRRERLILSIFRHDVLKINLPVLWILVVIQSYATFECTRASARVVALSSAVTLALCLALQRFVSIVASALLNAPPFPSMWLWFGAILVIAGAILYVIAPKPLRRVNTATNKVMGHCV